jgi:hypothetical protein
MLFEDLNGVRERPTIIRVSTTGRHQQRYDHRPRDLVQRTGDITIAMDLGVPPSTARGWLGNTQTARAGSMGARGSRRQGPTARLLQAAGRAAEIDALASRGRATGEGGEETPALTTGGVCEDSADREPPTTRAHGSRASGGDYLSRQADLAVARVKGKLCPRSAPLSSKQVLAGGVARTRARHSRMSVEIARLYAVRRRDGRAVLLPAKRSSPARCTIVIGSLPAAKSSS